MSEQEKCVVMDQFSSSCAASGANVIPAGQLNVDATSDTALKPSQVRLVEQEVSGLVLLRASTDKQIAALSHAMQACCGVGLPTRLSSNTQDTHCIRWMGPDAWLLSCPLQDAFKLEQELRSTVQEHIAIVQVSGGYSVFELSGAKALQVLKKSTGYDTHPDHFPTGKVVNTTFAKAQVTLRAVSTGDDSRYELIVRRSFSDYVSLWIQQAAFEYGLETTG